MSDSGWIQTFTGKKFYPLNPNPDDVCIEDIAHALSMICRYNGHCSRFYSVAEHSVIVSRHVKPEFALRGLLHDSAEAYISDLTKPVKEQIQIFKSIEINLEEAIFKKLGLDWTIAGSENVHDADLRILMDEKSQLLNHDIDWRWSAEPLGVEIECWSPDLAETRFLERFRELTA